MKDRFPKWWVLYSVAKSLFLKFGIISFLLIFFLCSISIIMDEHVRPEAYLYAITSCLLLFGPFAGNDSNLLIVFYVQIMPDDFVMQLHRF